jgi:hypothetical protein
MHHISDMSHEDSKGQIESKTKNALKHSVIRKDKKEIQYFCKNQMKSQI